MSRMPAAMHGAPSRDATADYTESQPVPPGAVDMESGSMKKLGIPLLLVGLMLSAQGFAATAQQNKMTTCNADASARSLKGDERKAFMSACLKASPPPAATQQDKMKTCNATAGSQALKGDARKAFMSDCLKKK
ncbi:Phosphate starvation-inducible protein PsiF [Pseudomonas caricapapayae]|nr:Phosphate starvation-inducible protein PsiF [Pseudomonas caricapapayae]